MNEKVEKDLQDLFGAGVDDSKKKKRSSGDAPSATVQPDAKDEVKVVPKNEKDAEAPSHTNIQMSHDHSNHADHSDHSEHQHKDKDDSTEEGENDDEDNVDESPESDAENGDDDKKKKKREAKSEVATNTFKWSNIFGIDRRKKSLGNSGYYPAHKLSASRNVMDDEFDYEEMDGDMKLDAMADKLKNIENLIIQDTVRYTGAHEGTMDPEEIQKMKNHVANRLATAYGVEKMRKAIEKLKESLRFFLKLI